MTPLSPVEERKRAAAIAAVAEVQSGMLVGLGTGSTAAHAITALAARLRDGLTIDAVATSLRSAEAATALGIRVRDFADVAAIDLCIDGVDEIDPQLRAIKGAGGAMLREKIVATSATRMIAIADDSKTVAQLGDRAVPVEFLPFAQAFTVAWIERLGGQATLRINADDQPYRTDQGNPILDCAFGPIADPQVLAAQIGDCPAILGHGLFLSEIDTIFIGTDTHVIRRDRQF